MGSWARPARVVGAIAIAAVVASACQGSWQTTATPSPVKAVHVALMHTGKVLLVAGSGNSKGDFLAGTFKTSVWDPTTETSTAVATPWDAFCSGHAFLPDGELLVAGGNTGYPDPSTNNSNAGSKKAYLFNPTTQKYVAEPDMGTARWYPTTVELGSGNIFTVGGIDERGQRTKTSQTFNSTLHTWTADKAPPAALNFMPLYPSLHLLSDGRVFYSGVNVFGAGPATPGIWNVNTNAWTPVRRPDRPRPPGPGHERPAPARAGPEGDGPRRRRPGPAGRCRRVHRDRGPEVRDSDLRARALDGHEEDVRERGDPARLHRVRDRRRRRRRCTTAATPCTARRSSTPRPRRGPRSPRRRCPALYHSSAILLPDGRVATFGGNPDDGFEMRIEIFTPGYLQKDTPRPTITSAPTEIAYNGSYSLRTTQAAALKSAVLVRPMAVTHSSDPAQRLVDLPFTTTANGVQVSVTNSKNIAPPGWYMLFVVDGNGVPSVAKWVHLS